MLKVYTYQGCSTCRNAVKWLKSQSIDFAEIPIRETPPSLAELQAALRAREGDLRGLFNTSGQDYRALGLKDKLPSMTANAALQLLSGQGNLVKRPFVADAERGLYLTGFHPDTWARNLPG